MRNIRPLLVLAFLAGSSAVAWADSIPVTLNTDDFGRREYIASFVVRDLDDDVSARLFQATYPNGWDFKITNGQNDALKLFAKGGNWSWLAHRGEFTDSPSQSSSVSGSAVVTPEPGTLILLGPGLAALVVICVRRRRS